MALILLVLSVAPVVFFAHQIYKRDFDKEPGRILIKLFISGIGSAFLTLFISSIITNIVPFFGYNTSDLTLIELVPYVFLGVALVEEFSKWIFVYTLEYNDNEFNHLYDGIVYAAFVALGFACFENILYVMQSGNISLDDGVRVAVVRAILAIPGHLCDGVMMGYYLSMAKLATINKNFRLKKKNLMLSLVIPAIAHGIYDYLLFACDAAGNDVFLLLFFAFVVFFFIYAYKKIKQLSTNTFNLNPNYITENERKRMESMNNVPVGSYGYANGYNPNLYNNIQYGYPTANQSYPQQSYNNMSYPQQTGYNQLSYQQPIYNTQSYPQQTKQCTCCGKQGNGKFCTNCGRPL
jgi:RsiW-degrading membrane proteinase PrsW (M82 family)